MHQKKTKLNAFYKLSKINITSPSTDIRPAVFRYSVS
jgi:hypothetical protein